MTEKDAKTKWCCGGPMQMLGLSQIVTGDKLLPEEGRCIASACMAWRWGVKRNPDWKPQGGAMAWPTSHPDDGPHTHIQDRENGYCGLAGRL